MSFRTGRLRIYLGYEVIAALTAVLLLDRENRVICCFLAAFCHELGHLLAMLLCGCRVRGVSLRLFDVLIDADRPDPFISDVFITLAGVSVNFILSAVFIPILPYFGYANLALGIFNSLPVMSLDGGHLLYIILLRRFSLRTSEIVLRVISFVFILPFLTAGIFTLFRSGYNYSLLAVSLYLLAILILKK